MTSRKPKPQKAEPERFKSWLAAAGVEVLVTTNPWETARWRDAQGVNVLYRNAKGDISSSGRRAAESYRAFRDNAAYPFKASPERLTSPERSIVVRTLLARDGDRCFYCRTPLGDDITLEHLIPRVAGGVNHIANGALAHEFCNRLAGHRPLTEKLALREQLTARAMLADALNALHGEAA